MDASHVHAHAPEGAADHGNLRSYLTGFGLSVLLTALPFALVMTGALSPARAAPVCLGLAAVQIVVHLVYFLHMNGRSSRSWNGAALLFTAIILVILVAGTLWVMAHMNANMMPGMMPPE